MAEEKGQPPYRISYHGQGQASATTRDCSPLLLWLGHTGNPRE